jgi:hypothetical protein
MKTYMHRTLIAATALVALTAFSATAQDAHVAPVTDYIETNVKPWLSDPVLVDAVKAQNAQNAGLAQADIDALDKKWRAETEGSSKEMIDGVLGNALSQFLKAKQQEAGGLITEVFVMDNKGLNVGQSDVTSDYWQGDEDKWSKTYGAGPDAIFIDGAEKDESTQMLQSQGSIAIKDPTSGEAIGAITVGINLDAL